MSWLTNTPKINEFSKVIITNLTEDESNVISIFKENFNKRDDVDFVYKAIPCIKITNQLKKEHIQWVGIKNENAEALLTNLFLGKDEYPLYYFDQPSATQGHIIASQEDSVFCLFNDTKKLICSFSEAKRNYIENWMVNNSNIIANGINTETNKLDNIYQTSKGYYQTKYVTFFETLHNKYISELFAKILLDRFIEEIKFNREDYAFNKILAVTVSSQLLGFGLRELIETKEDYAFLKGETNKIPEIISLASYFSFDSERPFEKIKANDKVLIINDVIATGSLNKKLIEKIIEKGASISSIMTIVDLRDENDLKSNKIESLLISILSSSVNKKISIQKYDCKEKIDGYSKEIQISRINPILNSIITLKHEHSENSRVLFKDSKDFLKLCPKYIFKIGHYKQNLTHNSYFTDMSRLFEKEIGISILEILKNKIEKDSEFMIPNNIELQTTIQNIEYNLLKLNSFTGHKLNDIIQNSIKELLVDAEQYNKEEFVESFQYSPDYIFYPAFSSIEKIEDKYFQQVFNTDIDNINSLQRYDTKNGWRFPFPAKRYNELIKGRHVLIIDSGSLTGDSLIQLIDSISFLEVGRIDFLSIIGRIDDFQREFYSRLRSIKVKNLKTESEEDYISKIVPLNILFATNLHIPPFYPEKCPFCVELKKINSYLDKNKRINLPKHAEDYAKYRKDEIDLIEGKFKKELLYIPLKDSEIDYEEIFIMRDCLGKVDGYRFYQEYFKYFDNIIDQTTFDLYDNKEILKKYELILICISHEPLLIGVLRDLLIEIYKRCQTILIDIIKKRVDLDRFNYIWNEYALVRLLFIFNENLIKRPDKIERILEFVLGVSESHEQKISLEQELSLGYISFILFEPIYNGKETSLSTIMQLEKNRKESNKVLYQNNSIKNLINEIVKNIEPTKDENVLNAFNNLYLFFSQDYREQHNKLLKSQISMFRNLLGNEPLPKNDIKNYIHSISARLEDTIFEYIKVIKKSPISKVDIPNHKEFFSSNNSIYSELKELIALERAIGSESKSSNIEIMFRDFESRIVNIQIKYLNDGNPFYEFCNKYSVNLKNCIITVLRDEEIRKLKDNCNCEIFGIENCDEFVTGNEFYFISAFSEIFKNAFKRNNTLINLSYEKGELMIRQDKPNKSIPQNGFYKSNGGIETILKPIFISFYGERGITFKHENTYEIIINFNKKQYG